MKLKFQAVASVPKILCFEDFPRAKADDGEIPAVHAAVRCVISCVMSEIFVITTFYSNYRQ